MSITASFIQSARLPDIEYRTVALEEIISSRVTTPYGMPAVYMRSELTVRTLADLEKAKPLLERSYTES